MVEYYQNNQDATQQLAGPLFEEKVIDFILELAKVTDVETTVEALYAEPETNVSKAAKKSEAKKATTKKATTKKVTTKKPALKKVPPKKPVVKNVAKKS